MRDVLPVGTEIHESSIRTACPGCGSQQAHVFFELLAASVNSITLWPTHQTAVQCPTGCIQLAFCSDCGAIYNQAFDAALLHYDTSYENSLHFSPLFRQYAEELVEDLIRRYDLHGKDIIEIGCGKGEFLAMLCDRGGNRGLGFDPTFVDGRVNSSAGQGFRVIHDYYSDAYGGYAADFVCCRQVLEHISDPHSFLMNIRQAIGKRLTTAVFFEVPNALFTLRQMGIWDVIYEHCVYYSSTSLQRLLRACGFEPVHAYESFGGQYLCVHARPFERQGEYGTDSGELSTLCKDVQLFGDHYRRNVEQWRRRLEAISGSGQRAVLWGAGAKGTTFLNAMRDVGGIEYAVDINPHKHGRFIPGTGQQVVAPEFLRQYKPDLVVITNPNYKEEIVQSMADLGLRPEFRLV